MQSPYFPAMVNTMNAGRLEMLCAKLFGKRSLCRDGDMVATISRWRGRDYSLGVERRPTYGWILMDIFRKTKKTDRHSAMVESLTECQIPRFIAERAVKEYRQGGGNIATIARSHILAAYFLGELMDKDGVAGALVGTMHLTK